MSRPYDWSPLDLDGDPTPGDVVGIESLSKRYADTATAIDQQAQRLRSLAANADAKWKGKAGDAFRKRAGDLADHIEKARSRYASTADALHVFATAIDDPQTQADAALRKATAAREDLASSAPLPAAPAGSPPPTAAETADATRRSQAHGDAARRLAEAKTAAGNAASAYRTAATNAKNAIHAAIQHDGVHDTWWDRNAGWIKTALKWVGVAILVIAIVVVVIATMGAAAPALLLAAAPFLELAVMGLTAVSLAGHIALAASGNGSWMDAALDLVGLFSCGLGRWGVEGLPMLGRALPSVRSAAVNAETLARGVAGLRAGRIALTESGLPAFAFRLAEHPQLTRLANLVLPGLSKAMPDAVGAAQAARSGVKVLEGSPLSLRFLTEGRAEVAENLNKLRGLNNAVPDIVRNQLRAVAAFTAAGSQLIGDAGVAAYGAHDVYEKFWAEPHEDADLDRELEQLLAHYGVVSGQVR